MASSDENAFIALKDITKKYGGVTALDNADFQIKTGEAICLAGENGSGKSTLIKILVGVEQPTSGHIFIDGKEFIRKSRNFGIEELKNELNRPYNLMFS